MALVKINSGPSYPNGLESWLQTHFEISIYIHQTMDIEYYRACEIHICAGRPGLVALAKELTDSFELLTAGISWYERSREKELEKFLFKFDYIDNILSDEYKH